MRTLYVIVVLLVFLLPTKTRAGMLDSLPAYYQRVVDISDVNESPKVILPTADGGQIVAGDFGLNDFNRTAFIQKQTADGIIEWTIEVNTGLSSSSIQEIVQLKCGVFVLLLMDRDIVSGVYRPSVAVLDHSGKLLWCKNIFFSNSDQLFQPTLFALSPRSDTSFLLAGHTYDNFEFTYSYIMNVASTGNVLWGKRYPLEFPNALIITQLNARSNGRIRAVGTQVISDSDKVGTSVIEFDENGNFLKGRAYTIGSGFNELVSLFHHSYQESINSENITATFRNYNDVDSKRTAALLRLNDDLTVDWLKSYQDTSQYLVNGAEEVIPLPNGNMLVNFVDVYHYNFSSPGFTDPDETTILGEVDTLGNVVWMRKYPSGGSEEYTRILLDSLGVATTVAPSTAFQEQMVGNTAILENRFNPFTGDGFCGTYEEMYPVVADIPFQVDTIELIAEPFDSLVDADITVTPIEDITVLLPCLDAPANPRPALVRDVRTCTDDSLRLAVRVCNAGYRPLPSGLPYALYAADPTAGPAPRLLADTLTGGPLSPTVCRNFNLRLPLPDTTTAFHLVVNDPGTLPPPFDLVAVSTAGGYEDATAADNVLTFTYTAPPVQPATAALVGCPGDTLLLAGVSLPVGGAADTVVLTDLRGCDSLVIARAVPATLGTTDTLRVCSGEVVLVFGDTVTMSGTYQATFDAASGCGDSLSTVVVDIVPPLGAALVATAQTPGQQDGTLEVVNAGGGTPPYTYTWSDGGMGASRLGLVAGEYTVTVTDARGCSLVLVGTVEIGTGLYKLPGLDQYTLYPRPVKAGGTVYLEVTANSPQRLRYRLLGADGRRLTAWERHHVGVGTHTFSLLIAEQAGTYFIELAAGGSRHALPLVVH